MWWSFVAWRQVWNRTTDDRDIVWPGMVTLLAESYLHRLDPFALKLPASWSDLPFMPDGLRWYGLSYAAGFIVAWLLVRWLAATRRCLVPVASVTDFIVYIVVGTVIGGRLGFVLFYDPALVIDFSGEFPFWGVLALNRGGMASHGGIIGVIAATVLFAHRHHIPKWHIVDVDAFICPPGLFLGRLANFVNAELWGEPLPASMQNDPPWWSVKYPDELIMDRFDLARLQDVRSELLTQLDLQPFSTDPQLITATRQALLDGNQAVADLVQPLLTAYYPSQLAQALMEGPVLFAALVLIWLRPRRPGVVGGWFLLVYGVLRILTELVRQPDEGVSLLLGLSRGQVLSVLMVLVGIAAVILSARRDTEPIGGLLKRQRA